MADIEYSDMHRIMEYCEAVTNKLIYFVWSDNVYRISNKALGNHFSFSSYGQTLKLFPDPGEVEKTAKSEEPVLWVLCKKTGMWIPHNSFFSETLKNCGEITIPTEMIFHNFSEIKNILKNTDKRKFKWLKKIEELAPNLFI